MTHLLPPPLLRLFAPRPPLEYAKPLPGDKDPNARPPPRGVQQVEQGKIRPCLLYTSDAADDMQ